MDSAQWWEQQGASKQKETRKKYNDAGIKIIVSVFGGSPEEMSITSKIDDPEGLAKKIGDWVKKNNLDGVDVDYEVGTATDHSSTILSFRNIGLWCFREWQRSSMDRQVSEGIEECTAVADIRHIAYSYVFWLEILLIHL